MTVVRSAESSR